MSYPIPRQYLFAVEKDISCVINNIHDKVITAFIKVLDQWRTTYYTLGKDELCFCLGMNMMESKVTILNR